MVETRRWIRVKSDGAVKINTSYIAASGVLRNHNGKWILGFNHKLGKCTIFEAKLWVFLMV
ncbi:hypothetical protein Gogos_011430 [Gossypium gossypioides]|uniref:RNase H type-1 domain-containing protein n=1 Tax=Gossypium gossypioides TaxID=34282 RepID=A0A7J9BPM7_GOSGO|nr:hypothetical protein [Gossypium gossypioides]